jgi:ABC-type branched-subunit amino acid transport system ATPase component
MFGLIGPNGAGKTTLINVINGVYKPERGEIHFGPTRLNDMAIYDIAQLGISRTFQVARVFRRMSVLENMVAPTIFLKESSDRVKTRVMELLDFVGLSGKRDQYAFELSGGQQKLLEFARALVTDPQLVLMDEPFAGVHPEIKAQLIDNIKELNEKGKTFIVVSHDMRSISDLCTHVVVLNFGEKLTEGPPEQVLTDEQVIEAYLGD